VKQVKPSQVTDPVAVGFRDIAEEAMRFLLVGVRVEHMTPFPERHQQWETAR
jgi:hypothetical protein